MSKITGFKLLESSSANCAIKSFPEKLACCSEKPFLSTFNEVRFTRTHGGVTRRRCGVIPGAPSPARGPGSRRVHHPPRSASSDLISLSDSCSPQRLCEKCQAWFRRRMVPEMRIRARQTHLGAQMEATLLNNDIHTEKVAGVSCLVRVGLSGLALPLETWQRGKDPNPRHVNQTWIRASYEARSLNTWNYHVQRSLRSALNCCL